MPDFLTLGASLDQKNAFLWSKDVFKNEETKLKSKYCHDDFDNWTNLEWRKLTLTITNNRVLVILVIESPKPTNSLGNFYFCFGRNETLVAPCITLKLVFPVKAITNTWTDKSVTHPLKKSIVLPSSKHHLNPHHNSFACAFWWPQSA